VELDSPVFQRATKNKLPLFNHFFKFDDDDDNSVQIAFLTALAENYRGKAVFTYMDG